MAIRACSGFGQASHASDTPTAYLFRDRMCTGEMTAVVVAALAREPDCWLSGSQQSAKWAKGSRHAAPFRRDKLGISGAPGDAGWQLRCVCTVVKPSLEPHSRHGGRGRGGYDRPRDDSEVVSERLVGDDRTPNPISSAVSWGSEGAAASARRRR
ncbi:unnamed protein product [Lota lota]